MNLHLLGLLESTVNDEDREWLVLQINLSGLDQKVRSALRAVAVPHWFDAKFAAALLDLVPGESEKLIERVATLSYVEVFPGRGFDVHESSRRLLLKDLWLNDESFYISLSRRASIYCEGQNLNDPSWRVEWIYHLLIADPERAVKELYMTCREWFQGPNFAYDKVEALLREAHEHELGGRLSEEALNTVLLWEGRLDLHYSRFDAAREKLDLINPEVLYDLRLLGDFSYCLGRLHQVEKDLRKARLRFDESLGFYERIGDAEGIARASLVIGEVEKSLGETHAAGKYFQKSLEFYRKIGDPVGVARSLDLLQLPGDIFLQNIDMITDTIARQAGRIRLRSEEKEDFSGWVKLKLIEDDYKILRSFSGAHSSLRTYLTVVIARLAWDYADSIGRSAKMMSDRFLANEDGLVVEVSKETPDQQLEERERKALSRRVYMALQGALETLPKEDRELIKMRMQFTVAQISRFRQVEQKSLYRKLDKIYRVLQKELERQGVRAKDIQEVLGSLSPNIDF